MVVHTIADVNRLSRLGLRDNVTLIPQGVQSISCTRPPSRDVLPQSPALIGCYGFFLPEKGILQLIEALAIVRRSYPNARLRLVNALYPLTISAIDLAAAKRLASALDLTDSIEFETDYIEESRSTALLAECDVIALPYQRSMEGSSAALRSAMMAQVPIGVTPLPLFDEADSAVFRFAGTDPAALAQGIVSLLADRGLRDGLVDRAEIWRERRNWSAVARRWTGLLLGLAGSSVTMGGGAGANSIR